MRAAAAAISVVAALGARAWPASAAQSPAPTPAIAINFSRLRFWQGFEASILPAIRDILPGSGNEEIYYRSKFVHDPL